MPAGRVLGPVALAAVLLLAGAGWAVATEPPPVGPQAWTRTGAVPTFLPEDGRVYVAADAGIEQARAFVAVGAGGTLVLAAGSGTAFPEVAGLLACPLTSPLTRSGELSADAAPAADCADPLPLGRAGDGSWHLPPEGLAGSRFGVALIPETAAGATFRLALDTGRTALIAPSPASAPAIPAATPEPAVAPVLAAPALLPAAPPDLATAPGPALAPADSTPIAVASGPVATPRPAAASAAAVAAAASPPASFVLGLSALLALAPGVWLGRRRPPAARPVAGPPGVPRTRTLSRVTALAAGFAAALWLPSGLSEADVYKVGLVLIFFVGAVGLHLLVNWAGELSLAHVALLALPAFAVAKLSADHGLSPILLLPVGVVVGAVAGGVVGLPAIRARGLQVALVTLAAGVAIDRFFFTKPWYVGPASGAAVEVPTLGPVTFTTARSLYPVLAVAVAATVAVAWALYRSKLTRALLWIKANPSAAAAFGVPVARYRALAYALAGAFAGLAGGLTAMWVQRLTPQAFPLSRSFIYLIVVALAGRGFVGGVALAALIIEGGRLFLANGDALMTYAGPIGLILTLTRYRDGLNGMVAGLTARVTARRPDTEAPMTDPGPTPLARSRDRLPVRPLSVAGVVATAVGFVAIGLAWYHAGNTSQVWIQNQELISGGLGGLALVVVGVGISVYDRVLAVREADADRWERLLAAVERAPVRATARSSGRRSA